MACFVQDRVAIIGINCIRTSELRNDSQVNTIANFRMANDFNIFVARNWIFMCLLFLPYWKPLGVGGPWNIQWIQRSTISTAYCSIDVSVVVIFVLIFFWKFAILWQYTNLVLNHSYNHNLKYIVRTYVYEEYAFEDISSRTISIIQHRRRTIIYQWLTHIAISLKFTICNATVV